MAKETPDREVAEELERALWEGCPTGRVEFGPCGSDRIVLESEDGLCAVAFEDGPARRPDPRPDGYTRGQDAEALGTVGVPYQEAEGDVESERG